MAQSDREIKMNIPRAISRDFTPRTFAEEKPIEMVKEVSTQEVKIDRRSMMKSIIPLSGKALGNFLRSLKTETRK